jgi:hypothetical protein
MADCVIADCAWPDLVGRSSYKFDCNVAEKVASDLPNYYAPPLKAQTCVVLFTGTGTTLCGGGADSIISAGIVALTISTCMGLCFFNATVRYRQRCTLTSANVVAKLYTRSQLLTFSLNDKRTHTFLKICNQMNFKECRMLPLL